MVHLGSPWNAALTFNGVNGSIPKTLVKYLVNWVALNGMDNGLFDTVTKETIAQLCAVVSFLL